LFLGQVFNSNLGCLGYEAQFLHVMYKATSRAVSSGQNLAC